MGQVISIDYLIQSAASKKHSRNHQAVSQDLIDAPSNVSEISDHFQAHRKSRIRCPHFLRVDRVSMGSVDVTHSFTDHYATSTDPSGNNLAVLFLSSCLQKARAAHFNTRLANGCPKTTSHAGLSQRVMSASTTSARSGCDVSLLLASSSISGSLSTQVPVA